METQNPEGPPTDPKVEDTKEDAASERPSRKRKLVDRYSFPSVSKPNPKKPVSTDKVRGTSLKDIPNGLKRSREMIDFGRVQKELQECTRDFEASGIKVSPVSDNLTRLVGTIPGPLGTPYEGGSFQIDISLPDAYPFQPPKMQFATKVWHPNISSQSGAICLDILKEQWSPALTLKTALLSIQALLSAPEPDDPQDAVVAQQYLRDYQTFVGTARYWTETFAKKSTLGIEEKVQQLVEMGFPESLVRTTLQAVGGDENLALEKLCSG